MGVYYGYVCDGIFQNMDQVNNHAQQAGKGAYGEGCGRKLRAPLREDVAECLSDRSYE